MIITSYPTKAQFPLFQSHIQLNHLFWRHLLQQDDNVIDATMGNGHDTLCVATLLSLQSKNSQKFFIYHKKARIIALDIDADALLQTQTRLKENGFEEAVNMNYIQLQLLSHEYIDTIARQESVKLIIYNLGYRPGAGKKEKTTMTETTLKSIHKASSLLKPGGVISITCYPGHLEGNREYEAIHDMLTTHSPFSCKQYWSVTMHEWSTRKAAPVLYLVQKSFL